jgi:hypothetical protein
MYSTVRSQDAFIKNANMFLNTLYKVMETGWCFERKRETKKLFGQIPKRGGNRLTGRYVVFVCTGHDPYRLNKIFL